MFAVQRIAAKELPFFQTIMASDTNHPVYDFLDKIRTHPAADCVLYLVSEVTHSFGVDLVCFAMCLPFVSLVIAQEKRHDRHARFTPRGWQSLVEKSLTKLSLCGASGLLSSAFFILQLLFSCVSLCQFRQRGRSWTSLLRCLAPRGWHRFALTPAFCGFSYIDICSDFQRALGRLRFVFSR